MFFRFFFVFVTKMLYLSNYFSQPMNIEDLLVKPSWRRRLPPKIRPKLVKGPQISRPMQFDSGKYVEMTQSDFLDELSSFSHMVNSVQYRSNRTKYKYDTATQSNVADGMEEVERVSFSLQEAIRRHKVTHTFGNPMWFGSEGKDPENDRFISLYKNHWNITGMTEALSQLGNALFGTGDAGIYQYRIGDEIFYKVFSFENGDVINMTETPDGGSRFIRMFMLGDARAVEIYDNENIELWVKEISDEKVKDTPNIAKSHDGYNCIKKVSHGLKRNPVTYFRIEDVVWGGGQNIIEHIEDLSSDLAENNKFYAYQILFLSGGVINLPPAGRMGKVIASKSVDGKAEILKPADASNTFSTDLENSKDLLWEVTGTVVIDPKELKAGENTGAFIRNLYWREVQWSNNMIAQLRPQLRDVVDIFKEYVKLIEGFNTQKIRMSFMLEPYVPKNTTEEVTNICQAVNAGILSKETGAGELSFSNPREVERLAGEREQDILDTLRIQGAKVVASDSKETTDNKAKAVIK